MKASWLWVLVSMLIIALVFLPCSLTGDAGSITMRETRRDMEETMRSKKKEGGVNVQVEDYNPIDPSPSSKAYVGPGPIEYGSPLIPYIPRPSPPKQGRGG